jgi:hypothetical protein
LDQGEGGGKSEAGLGLGQSDLVRATVDEIVDHLGWHLDWHGVSLSDRGSEVNQNGGTRAASAVERRAAQG